MLTAAASPAEMTYAATASSRPSADETMRALQNCVLDLRSKLLPDGGTLIDEFDFLTEMERRLVGHIQGRTYVNLFAALERLVDEETAEKLGDYSPADRIDTVSDLDNSAATRQMLFQRMDKALARSMPTGYREISDLDGLVRDKFSWGVRALALSVEFFKQAHYGDCAETDETLSPMFRNAFLREQAGVSMQAMIVEIEWVLQNGELSLDARDAAVDGLIELIEKLDRTLKAQAALDTRYFAMYCARPLDRETLVAVEDAFLKAYRWQYLFAGMETTRFADVLSSLVTDGQVARVKRALDTLA